MSTIDQQFIEFIVKSLVSKPDSVVVVRRIDEKGVLLELTVDPDDLGRIIGKRGATAQSLRTLLRALGTKNDARYNLKIVDNDLAEDGAERPTQPRDDINPDTSSTDVAAASHDNSGKDVYSAPEKPVEDHDSVAARTRKELAELDDLDI
ncbi:MAG TPA: KH domain-containing protein [Patescibacteria group bacterium]|jgi:predicted RNA-binding protein YlqC (UPF0109 family)|nr:KH domain-containing protein [Patescibacteria group bacterium]